MVSLRDSTRTKPSNALQPLSHNEKSMPQKRSAKVEADNKENKKPKLEERDAKDVKPSKADPAPDVTPINSTEKDEKSAIGPTSPKPQDLDVRPERKTARRDRRPSPGRNYEAIRDPNIRDNLGDDSDLIRREVAKSSNTSTTTHEERDLNLLCLRIWNTDAIRSLTLTILSMTCTSATPKAPMAQLPTTRTATSSTTTKSPTG